MHMQLNDQNVEIYFYAKSELKQHIVFSCCILRKKKKHFV